MTAFTEMVNDMRRQITRISAALCALLLLAGLTPAAASTSDTSQIIRVYLSRLIAQFYPDFYVLSFNEITSNVQIQAIGNIMLQQQEQPA